MAQSLAMGVEEWVLGDFDWMVMTPPDPLRRNLGTGMEDGDTEAVYWFQYSALELDVPVCAWVQEV